MMYYKFKNEARQSIIDSDCYNYIKDSEFGDPMFTLKDPTKDNYIEFYKTVNFFSDKWTRLYETDDLEYELAKDQVTIPKPIQVSHIYRQQRDPDNKESNELVRVKVQRLV